jgi:hypothetical protein
MSLKKKTEVRTGKMVRELMLADKDVTASLVMVYSNNGVNEEIKIEGLNPNSNEELFLSGNVDWNQSVIYKIVDFSGKAEVGKAVLTDMKKNNLTLQIERIMWSKEKQGEEKTDPQQEENKLTLVHTGVSKKEELPNSEKEFAIEAQPKKEFMLSETEAVPVKVKPSEPIAAEAKQNPVTSAYTKSTQSIPTSKTAQAAPKHDAVLQEKYTRIIAKAVDVCQDYELGMDVDDSIEGLKEELQAQGIKITLDPDILNVVNQLRTLKTKGINLEKVLTLV